MIEIYGKKNCPNCKKAVEIARKNKREYEYKNVEYTKYRTELNERLQKEARWVPQIWMDGYYIQDIDELEARLKFLH